MPALVAAYDKAPSSGRQFIEKTLAELDPSVLAVDALQCRVVAEVWLKILVLEFDNGFSGTRGPRIPPEMRLP